MNITNELQAQYKELISKGYTSKQIGMETNQSASMIKRNLKLLGLRTVHKRDPIIIDDDKLKQLVSQRYSIQKIADEFKCSHAPIKAALKRNGVKTDAEWTISRIITTQEIKEGYKTCPKCKVKKELTSDNFYMRNTKNRKEEFHGYCKDCNNKLTMDKQKQLKLDALNYKGGKCIVCGYNKYAGSLDFHHLDPSKKEFAISSLRAYKWENVKPELDKCVVLCKNCHGEFHGGIIKL